nr:NUDIX domain-containing protein [Actinoplanes teichomyceticus]
MLLRDDRAPYAPDVWGLPGGAVEAGETPVETAARELGAATGVAARRGDRPPGRPAVPRHAGRRGIAPPPVAGIRVSPWLP